MPMSSNINVKLYILFRFSRNSVHTFERLVFLRDMICYNRFKDNIFCHLEGCFSNY